VLKGIAPAPAATPSGGIRTIRELERDEILRALEETHQDKRRAAALLGISLKTLYNKLAKYGIQAVKSARIT
jgi:DNA-binding NtrC family response regulator